MQTLQVSFADFCAGYGALLTAGNSNNDGADSGAVPPNNIHIISDEVFTPEDVDSPSSGRPLVL